MLRELGLPQHLYGDQAEGMIERGVEELLEHGWLVGDERLRITDTGRERLHRGMRQGTRTHGLGRVGAEEAERDDAHGVTPKGR